MVVITAKAVAKIASLTQSINGADTYSNSRALFGYIESAKYLVVTAAYVKAMKDWHMSVRSPSRNITQMGARAAFGKFLTAAGTTYADEKDYVAYGETEDEELDIFKMLIMNYIALRKAGLSVNDAYIAAAYRSRWLSLGCLFTTSETEITGNNTPFIEVIIADNVFTDGKDALSKMMIKILAAEDAEETLNAIEPEEDATELLVKLEDDDIGIHYIIHTAECIWGIAEYLYRTRGHHWKDDYEELARKIFESNFQGNLTLPSAVALNVIFHTSIHPFAILMLPTMTYHFALLGKIGNSTLLRLEAAPNGVAMITTTAAALTAIRTEPWYTAFHKSMKDFIEVVTTLANEVLADKYAYHMSANLYGVQAKKIVVANGRSFTIDEAKSEVAPVATVVQGFINQLDKYVEDGEIKGFSLSNTRALQKHASGNPMLSMKVSILMTLASKFLMQSKKTGSAALMVFPDLASDAAAEGTVTTTT